MSATPSKPATRTWDSLKAEITSMINGRQKGYELSCTKWLDLPTAANPLVLKVIVYAGEKVVQNEWMKSEEVRKREVFEDIGGALLFYNMNTRRIAKNWAFNQSATTFSFQCDIEETTTHDKDHSPGTDHSKEPKTEKTEIKEIKVTFHFSGDKSGK